MPRIGIRRNCRTRAKNESFLLAYSRPLSLALSEQRSLPPSIHCSSTSFGRSQNHASIRQRPWWLLAHQRHDLVSPYPSQYVRLGQGDKRRVECFGTKGCTEKNRCRILEGRGRKRFLIRFCPSVLIAPSGAKVTRWGVAVLSLSSQNSSRQTRQRLGGISKPFACRPSDCSAWKASDENSDARQCCSRD